MIISVIINKNNCRFDTLNFSAKSASMKFRSFVESGQQKARDEFKSI